MTFSCPDCLVTSPNPKDEENSYCFVCHEFKDQGVSLTPFQVKVGKALHAPQPLRAVRNVIALHWMALMSLSRIYEELLPLQQASKLTEEQRLALGFMITSVANGDLRGLSNPKDPTG